VAVGLPDVVVGKFVAAPPEILSQSELIALALR
jgi:hypothetical protein